MTTRSGYVLAAAGFLALLGAASAGAPPAGFWAPEGFVARADSLIGSGGLELRCADQDSIVVRLSAGGADERFFDASYLRADVRTFNASPDASRSPFLVEGCRLVGVDPFYHRVDLPYNRVPRWRGDVRFTYAGRAATLEGGPDQRLEVRHPLDRADAAGGSVRVSPAERGAETGTSLLRLTRPGTREVVAEAFFVGDHPVLVDRRDVGSADAVRVDGFRTPPGRAVRLESGDWVQLETGSGLHTWLAETGDRARTASFVRVRNDRVDRLYPARRLAPFLSSFARAMDGALQSIPGLGDGPGPVVDTSVRLTLDRELTDALDAELAAWCAERALPDRPRAASLLVMDAFDGSVRAMPSCPGEPELARFEPLSSRTRERFLRNQNLAAHPVGSAAKPFWTAAVATAYPNVVDLEVPSHPAGPVGSVLGCPLAATYGDGHAAAAWTGLEEFLQRSCNRYLVEMASAALVLGSSGVEPSCRQPASAAAFARCFPEPGGGREASRVAAPDPAPTGTLRFCDRVVATVLAPDLDVVGQSCDDLQLLDSRFAAGPALSELTNVALYRDRSPAGLGEARAPVLGDRYRLGRYRIDAWRGVLDALAAAGDTAHLERTALRFAGVSPRATNLALNTVEELRTDWVNLLLGGENSRWSNFELAEATARLVTGRAVRGRFVDSVAAPGTSPGALRDSVPPLGEAVVRDGVRRRVLHAMELVARPGGTAAALAPALERTRGRLRTADPSGPWELYAFAKTGTPAVETYVAGGRRLDRQGGVLILSLLAVPADRGRAAAAATPGWVSACPLDPGLRRAILEVPPAEALDPERSVALSVAVYLDDLAPGEGSGGAVVLTARVADALGSYLEREVRRKAEADGG